MTDRAPDLATYAERWRALVTAWTALADRPEEQERLLGRALDVGLLALEPPAISSAAPVRGDEEACATAVIRRHGGFDTARYLHANPEVERADADPVEHFCEKGWAAGLNPSPEFDVWWYATEYLADELAGELNPYVHYLLAGRFDGLLPRPVAGDHPPTSYPAGRAVRRICLFAAHDVDGIVDEYVVAYLRELSRYADVYYLADGRMQPGELDRLGDVTVAAWAVPHDGHEAGSHAILARDLVGWDVIEDYDELILADDGCYLLRPLDELFARMDATVCDGWGMELISRLFAEQPGEPTAPLSEEEARRRFLGKPAMRADDPLHVGPEFVCLRRPAIGDRGLRRRVERPSIIQQPAGVTPYLIGQGYVFTAAVPELYPFPPACSRHAFELIRHGLPLLQRRLLGDNPSDVPDLVAWKEQVRELVPDAPVEVIERNLHRVVPADRLERSFAIRTRPDGTVDHHRPLTRRAFRRLDRRTPKFDHWWAFPVCGYDHTFAGNERAVFDAVRDDPSIKKVILTRSRRISITGENVEVAPLMSPEGQQLLARSRQIFVKHGPTINAYWPVSSQLHNIINLWHGIPLKRFGFSALELDDAGRAWGLQNHGSSRAVIASSRMDALAMNASFFPASYPDLWVTGLPRNDVILRPDDELPSDLRASVERLRTEVGDRRLVLFLPTFKDGQETAYYRFDEAELARLRSWAERHHAVLGIREHMADSAGTYSQLLDTLEPIDVSSRRYPDLEVLYRVADALISDYSSCLVDFMMTGKPMISFAYDYERYTTQERGLVYRLDDVLPGPVCRDFDALVNALERVFDPPTPEQVADYEWRRRIFFDHVDTDASWRVVQRVKSLYR